MRIILISLIRAAARRQLMQERFQALGLDYEILDATDGADLTAAQRARVDHDERKKITRYPLSDNEIGCYFSHLRAMASVASGTQAMAAIMEDDVTLDPRLPTALAAIEAKAAPFDAIDLHRTMKKNEIFAPCAPLAPELSLGRIGYTHMNLQGYVISRQGAQRFLDRTPRIAHAVDKELHRYWANGLDLYGLSRPRVAHADGGHSMIEETRGPRTAYPDADQWRWRLARFKTKVTDSIANRLAFPPYVSRGRELHSSTGGDAGGAVAGGEQGRPGALPLDPARGRGAP